jgi:hypothetical protein
MSSWVKEDKKDEVVERVERVKGLQEEFYSP